MKPFIQKPKSLSKALDCFILVVGLVTFCFWFTGKGLFYSNSSAVLSPFTSLSLVLMVISRLAGNFISTWSKPMTLALLGMVSCGNLSSLWIQLASPELFLATMPEIVPTSAMTSLGLIAFCFYEVLVVIRKTPRTAFIIDDILLHIALFPGGLSLLGHILGVQAYMASQIDPRAGIGGLEMILMGAYAVSAAVSNPNLFLWRFLSQSIFNRAVFCLLFLNQYVAPVLVGFTFRRADMSTYRYGIEFYVMLAGVLATLTFLIINAVGRSKAASV